MGLVGGKICCLNTHAQNETLLQTQPTLIGLESSNCKQIMPVSFKIEEAQHSLHIYHCVYRISFTAGCLPLTCLISHFNFLMPVRSVLVAPVCPSSWMEMAGLVAMDSVGRTYTEQTENNNKIQTGNHIQLSTSFFFIQISSNQTHHSSPLQTLYHSRCDEADFSYLMDWGSSSLQMPPRLTGSIRVMAYSECFTLNIANKQTFS